jgi:general secretion pathway protein C
MNLNLKNLIASYDLKNIDLRSLRDLNYENILGRVMRRHNIARMVRSVNLASSAILAISIVLTLIILGDDLLTQVTARSKLDSQVAAISVAAPDQQSPGAAPAHQWDVIKERKPFGSLGKLAVPVAAPPAPPPSPLMLSLIGTFITAGQDPYAIIEDKKKNEQEMFLIGDSIFSQATLKSIHLDRVEVERNGKLEVLRLDELLAGASGNGTASTTGDDFVIEEAELDKGLENLPLLLTQARAVPYFKDGRSIGLRMFAIKTGSLYERVGLKNGDILKTINGNNLGDISQALKLFEQLKQERSINLTLERDKQEREFKYTIR